MRIHRSLLTITVSGLARMDPTGVYDLAESDWLRRVDHRDSFRRTDLLLYGALTNYITRYSAFRSQDADLVPSGSSSWLTFLVILVRPWAEDRDLPSGRRYSMYLRARMVVFPLKPPPVADLPERLGDPNIYLVEVGGGNERYFCESILEQLSTREEGCDHSMLCFYPWVYFIVEVSRSWTW